MSVLGRICIWHAIAHTIYVSYGESIAQTSDRAVLIVFGVIYALIQLVFAVAVAIPVSGAKRPVKSGLYLRRVLPQL